MAISSKGRGAKGKPKPNSKTAKRKPTDLVNEPSDGKPAASFPIAGIGGSAGSLEALVQLLSTLGRDTGIGFVFVQHLDPTHESMLADILTRSSKLPVHEARDRMPVLANHLYLVTPNKDLEISGGVLRVITRADAPALHMPIDHFFRSLAEDIGHQAIGVVLSGTGSDGARGLLAIKAAGGITFAQEPVSAKYDGMPRAAIAGGELDFILPPERIAAELHRIGTGQGPTPAQIAPVELTRRDEEELRLILTAVNTVTGVDLSFFKPSNLLRRIYRRMLLNHVDGLEQYRQLLRANAAEAMALQHDILIGVTSFFRDGGDVEGLAKVVFPAIAKNRTKDQPIRVWVPGCASGEEAYSIAIALTEFLDGRLGNIPVQIFATDISEAAIERARAGFYPSDIAADVSPARLRRFFVKLDNGYQVNKSIRERCVFARHNLITDPPFSQIDLISCRNVLIYFRPEYQRRAIDAFYYALRRAGFLILSRSESVAAFGNIFATVDKHYRIYAKRPNALRPGGPPLGAGYALVQGGPLPGRMAAHSQLATSLEALQKEADRLVMERYAPAGIVINEDLDVVQFRGRTGALLEPAPGLATLNLIKIAREELRLVLQGALYQARKRNAVVRKEGLEIKHNGRSRKFNLEITPIKLADSPAHYYLVLFEEPRPAPPAPAPGRAKRSRRESRGQASEIEQLTKELAESRGQTQAIIEELEATNEEMKAANEEVLSSNEELQSMNEELETAKEELQSANEELTTLNEELQNRNDELSQVAADLTNLLASVSIPIVMLSRDLRIRRYTPMATKVLNVIPSDVGRPISDMNLNIDTRDLENLVSEAMESMAVREREVQDRNGRWYSLRIQPFRTLENHINGAVLILIDIDDFRRNLETARAAHDLVQTIIDALRNPLVVLDNELRLRTANRAFYETFDRPAGEVVGHALKELNNGMWDVPALSSMLAETVSRGVRFDNTEIALKIPGNGSRSFLMSSRPLQQEPGKGLLILLAIEEAGASQ
jgi:two-component system CheB/CheR fusion protein